MAEKVLNLISLTDGTHLYKRDLTQVDRNQTAISQLSTVIGNNAEKAALVDKANTFTEGQTIQGKVSDSSENAFLSLKLTNYTQADGTAGDSGVTESKTLVNTSDKTGVQVSALETKATTNSVVTQISVSNGDVSAKGALSVEFNRNSNNFTAKAPSALDHTNAQEIATVDYVTQKITDANVPQATVDVAGKVELATNEETAAGTDDQRAVTPAGLAYTLTPIKEELDSLQSGNINFAYKDYTQSENQEEMLQGVIYLVPFNKVNEFLELDPNTNKPKDPQPVEETVDLEIAYYQKMIKGSEAVTDLGKTYTAANLQDVAYLSKAANFTAALTSTVGAADMSSNTIEVPNAQQVREFVNTQVNNAKVKVVTSAPEQGSMTPGVLYLVTTA